MCGKLLHLCPTLSVILWAVAHQAPVSLGFSRQEYWSILAMTSSRGSSQTRATIYILSKIMCELNVILIKIQRFFLNNLLVGKTIS